MSHCHILHKIESLRRFNGNGLLGMGLKTAIFVRTEATFAQSTYYPELLILDISNARHYHHYQ